MAESYVQLPPQSTGLKMRTVENTISSNLVEQSVSTLADSTGNLVTATSNRLDVNIQAIPAGSAAIGSVSVSNFPATQPVSGTVTANAGTGTMAVSGPLTDTQLRATAVPVSGTFYQATQPVSGTVAVTGAGDATAANQSTANTSLGGVTETAPASDTASAGLNGRLQRIAQRLTSLIALLPTSLGQKTMANGLAVTVASDQSALPVTGTFWQATQPVSGTVTANAGTGTMAVSGPLTDTQLRATAVPVSGTVSVNALPAGSNIIGDVRVVNNRNSTFVGFGSTFKIAGIAGTAGQKLFTMHNATGSTILVDITALNINLQATVAKTVAPPNIRVHRITVLPTGGTAVPKIAADTNQSSSSSLTILQGASSDTAASAITATIPGSNIVVTMNAERLLTVVGQDYQTGLDLLPINGKTITLRALQGICIELVYTLATQNPTTDLWGVNVVWEEYS
jgi:hypothetical protein